MADYRLQTLLSLREQAEEEAEHGLASALQALAQAREALAQQEALLAGLRRTREARERAHLEEALARGAGAGALDAAARFAERLRAEEAAHGAERARQQQAVATAEEAVALRRQALLEAARERQALEKHREGWARGVRAEQARQEELAQEEVAGARQGRGPRERG